MPNQITILARKDLLFRAVPLLFTVIFFLQIAPIPQLQFMRNVDPIQIWSSTLLLVDGFVLVIEFFRNLPDVGNHLGAKSGAYIFLIMGIIAFLFGIFTLSGIYDPFANTSEAVTNTTLTIMLGLTSVIMYASVHPALFHQKKNLAKLIRG